MYLEQKEEYERQKQELLRRIKELEGSNQK